MTVSPPRIWFPNRFTFVCLRMGALDLPEAILDQPPIILRDHFRLRFPQVDSVVVPAVFYESITQGLRRGNFGQIYDQGWEFHRHLVDTFGRRQNPRFAWGRFHLQKVYAGSDLRTAE